MSLLLDLSDRMSFVLAGEVLSAYHDIGSHIDLKVYYLVLKMTVEEDYKKKHCFGDGEYCAVRDPGAEFGNGQLVIL